MSREAPPPLHFTRQWTQPTDMKHYTLSRVKYPLRQESDGSPSPSPSPSPLRDFRTPRSPATVHAAAAATASSSSPSSSARLNRSATRSARQPLVASPLPTQPSLPSSCFTDLSRTTPSRQAPPYATSATPAQAAVLPSEAAGQLFWQQQAQRFEEANAVLRQELNAVYRVLNNIAAPGDSKAIQESRRDVTERAAPSDRDVPRTSDRPGHTPSHNAYLSLDTVVQERNIARMELAQEREKNFLLRHRLRESEMEVERLLQRLRVRDSHREGNQVAAAPPPRHMSPSAREKRRASAAAAAVLSKPRRPLSRSTSRASSTSSATNTTAASSSSSPVARQGASYRSRTSSPRPRSVTQRQSSHRGDRDSKEGSVSSVEGRVWDTLKEPRLSRGYARLHRRSEAYLQRAAAASSSSHAHRLTRGSTPSSLMKDAPSDAASPSLAENRVVLPQQESRARALLSSLLASHRAPVGQPAAAGDSHRGTVSASQSEAFSEGEAKKDYRASTAYPRQVFQSRLFGEAEAARNGRLLPNNNHVDNEDALNHTGVQNSYIARQLVSPTPPLRTSRSPTEMDSLASALAPCLSSSGSWLSVSLTTEENLASRGLSVRDEALDETAGPGAYHSFSL